VHYVWNFEAIQENWWFLLGGIWMTIALTVLCMVVGSALGILVALLRLSRLRALRASARVYTELLRTTPLMVQIVWVYYVLPILTGIALTPFLSGLIAVGMNLGAYVAEIFRGGIMSVSPGQMQAGLALGMTRAEAMRRVVLPQAVMRMIPPLASTWVSLFKDTSILAAIGVSELMFRAQWVATNTYRPLEVFSAIACAYFIITYPQSIAVNYLYRVIRTQE
jgi:polar amino acid transport system permease protein